MFNFFFLVMKDFGYGDGGLHCNSGVLEEKKCVGAGHEEDHISVLI